MADIIFGGDKERLVGLRHKASNPFIFSYGSDRYHRPYTTDKLRSRKKRDASFDPRRYSYRKEHNGLFYEPYILPPGWKEITNEQTGETIYHNLLTSSNQLNPPVQEATIQGLRGGGEENFTTALLSTLPHHYPGYLQKRSRDFMKELKALHGTYKTRAISPGDFRKAYNEKLQSFGYQKHGSLSELESDVPKNSSKHLSLRLSTDAMVDVGSNVVTPNLLDRVGNEADASASSSSVLQRLSSGGSSLGDTDRQGYTRATFPVLEGHVLNGGSSLLAAPLAAYRSLSKASFEGYASFSTSPGIHPPPTPSVEACILTSLHESDNGRDQDQYESITVDVDNAVKCTAGAQEEYSQTSVFYNSLRLGNVFCLWCGHGPMPMACRGRKCIPLYKCSTDIKIPKSLSLARHCYPCKKHNHLFSRGECPGRCLDCGGCNMGEACSHVNPSGGPLHPNAKNLESIPNCVRTDGTRCFREGLLEINDPVRNAPSRPHTQPIPCLRKKSLKSKRSVNDNSGKGKGRLSLEASPPEVSTWPSKKMPLKYRINATPEREASIANCKLLAREAATKTGFALRYKSARVRPKSSPAMSRVSSAMGKKHGKIRQKKSSESSIILRGNTGFQTSRSSIDSKSVQNIKKTLRQRRHVNK